MNERQYQISLRNRPPRRAAPLFSGPRDSEFLRRAARAVSLRERAQEALATAVPPELVVGVRISSVRDGLVELRATSAWQREALRQRLRGVERAMLRISGVRGVRMAVGFGDDSEVRDTQ